MNSLNFYFNFLRNNIENKKMENKRWKTTQEKSCGKQRMENKYEKTNTIFIYK